MDIDTICRFLDKLKDQLKEEGAQIAFDRTKEALKEKLTVVFYDMTTHYFEANDEDDQRRTSFSKDDKHQNPHIYLGFLIGHRAMRSVMIFSRGVLMNGTP